MDYELDYNFGTFVLTNWATKSETTISELEAFDWSARRYNCRTTKRAAAKIDKILDEMQLCSAF